MGDDQRRATLAHLLECALDVVFSLCVQRARRLVQKHNLGVLEDGACNSDALLLAARQSQPALPHLRLPLLGEVHDRVVDLGRLGSLFHVVLGGVRAPVRQIVLDGVVEEHRVLGHHSDGLPQRLLLHIPDILPVDSNSPAAVAIEVVEAEEEARYGAFACASLAHERRSGAGRDDEVDVAEDGGPRASVLEIDLVVLDRAPRDLELGCVGEVDDLWIDLEELEHLLHVNEALLDDAPRCAQPVQRRCYLS
mmetsp:Transcript_28399/g.67582  ORF Transcript_28399/g.67582 Transcript_28399/m.67582 type:complete len:251 (-) Transcript_28399:186-938(-)